MKKDNLTEENLKYLDYLNDSNNHEFERIGESNQVIKHVKNIIANTKPNPEKLFVGDGIWAQQRILETNTRVVNFIICPEYIYTNEALQIVKQIFDRAEHKYIVSAKTFDKLSERDQPDGLLSLAQLPQYDINALKPKDKSIILILDGIEIPGNIGTMLRVCDGAGVDAVFICNRKARLSHPKLIKGSMGAVLTVPIYEFTDVGECYNWLQKNDFQIYLADTRAEHNYFEEHYHKKTAFVMGSERYGISRDWYKENCNLISIPMLGKCDSLNVGVAATVLIYNATMKIKMEAKYV